MMILWSFNPKTLLTHLCIGTDAKNFNLIKEGVFLGQEMLRCSVHRTKPKPFELSLFVTNMPYSQIVIVPKKRILRKEIKKIHLYMTAYDFRMIKEGIPLHVDLLVDMGMIVSVHYCDKKEELLESLSEYCHNYNYSDNMGKTNDVSKISYHGGEG